MVKHALLGCVVLLVAVSLWAADTEGKKVDLTGTLKTGIMAIGAETTGTIIVTKDGTFELSFGKDKDLKAKSEKLNGKQVSVSGTLTVRKGVEVKERKIVEVTSLDEAKK